VTDCLDNPGFVQGTVLAVSPIAGTITLSQPGNDPPLTIPTDGATTFSVSGQAAALANVLVGMLARISPVSAIQAGTATAVIAWTPAPASFNAQMVAKLEAAILKNPVADTVTVDGTTVRMVDVIRRLAEFRALLARETGQRPRIAHADLRVGSL